MSHARMRRAALYVVLPVTAACGLFLLAGTRVRRAAAPYVLPAPRSYEAVARERFHSEHPGEKPLNWSIAAAAARFYKSRPMGKFVLGLQPGEWGNDCSDFVACAVDEGLGVRARFARGSDAHICEGLALMDALYWRPGMVVQPGDIVSVRHSPWYEPYEGACWHVGVIGPDGDVYDFVKLRRWESARYGKSGFEWFVRHSRGSRDVVIERLRPEYRYGQKSLPDE